MRQRRRPSTARPILLAAAAAACCAAAAASCATSARPSPSPASVAAAVAAGGSAAPAAPGAAAPPVAGGLDAADDAEAAAAAAIDDAAESARRARADSSPAPPAAPAAALSDSTRIFLESSLSRWRRADAASGAKVAALRLEGRRRAALRFSVRCDASSEYETAIVAALVLEAASRGPELSAALRAAGAEASLDFEGPDEAALEVDCPVEAVDPLARALAGALASPGLDRDSFEPARRKLFLAELRKEGEPSSSAAARTRSASAAKTLNRITPAEAASLWDSSIGGDRVAVVVVGEIDPPAAAEGVAKALGAWPSRGPGAAPSRDAEAALPSGGALQAAPLGSAPGSAPGCALLACEFRPSLPGGLGGTGPGDYGAALTALAMLGELLERELPIACGPGATAEIRLPDIPGDSALVIVRGISDPLAAKAAVESSVAVLSSGSCAGAAPGGGDAAIASRLGRYKARAIVDYYSGCDSAEIARRIARSLAAGGDGTDYFRAAALIAAAGAADVERFARERLSGGSAQWAAAASRPPLSP